MSHMKKSSVTKNRWGYAKRMTSCVVVLSMLLSSSLPSLAAQTEESRENEGRREILINEGWNFGFQSISDAPAEPDFDDSGWEPVELPHTWNNKDAQDGAAGGRGESDYRRDVGWYRKNLEWEEGFEGKEIYLEFLGAAIKAEVFVNGESVGTHEGGYTAFCCDITGELHPGENLVAVKVDNREDQNIAPLSGDFNFYGGIYRNVSLIVTDPVHGDLMDHGSSGLYLTTENVTEESADLGIRADIVNDSDQERRVRVEAILRHPGEFEETPQVPDPDFSPEDMENQGGLVETVEEDFTIPPGESRQLNRKITVENPRLWNGREDPYRYEVDLNIRGEDGALLDQVTQYVGFRYFSVDKDQGFFLNGKSYPLRGVCRHQDWKDMGNAITSREQDTDFGMIYEIGANALRLAHYPQDPYFYDLCDRYGIVVWAEIPFVDMPGTGPRFQEVTENQLTELIRQQYNRPSICFWGLQNEVREQYDNVMKNTLLPALNELAHREDPTGRLTTQATNHGTGANWPSDLMAWNTYPGWYGGGSLGSNMDARRQNRPVGISEYGAGANILQHEENPSQPSTTGAWHPEEYQNKLHEAAIRDISSRKYLWGTFLWNMFDFACDERLEGDQPGINDKGLVTYDRKVKKDSFYLYKANWNKRDYFTHIASARFNPRENEKTTVKVYSNCDSVSLSVNGRNLGTKKNDGYGIFQWEDVSLASGKNQVRAVGAQDGENYTQELTWDRTRGRVAQVTSQVLTVDESAKRIYLTQAARAEEVSSLFAGVNGAVFTLWNEDGTEEVREGGITPGMQLRVVSEDGKEEAVYLFASSSLTLNQPVTVSSQETANPGEHAVDGSGSTRWAAVNGTFPQWLEVDLGKSYALHEIELDWFEDGKDRSYQYRVEAGESRTDYETVLDRTQNSQGGQNAGNLKGKKARYLKITVTGCSKAGAYASLRELRVNGWRFGQGPYEIDEEKGIVQVPNTSAVITTAEFLENIGLEGNAVPSLDSESYFIQEGDCLSIQASDGTVRTYRITLTDTLSNLALGKKVLCSTQEEVSSAGENTLAANITDGDLETRWAAAKTDGQGTTYPQWVTVDLGRIYELSDLTLYFYQFGPSSDRSYRYRIYTASEGDGTEEASFRLTADASENTDNSQGLTHDLHGERARYVKVEVLGCSLFDAGSRWAAASIQEILIGGRIPCNHENIQEHILAAATCQSEGRVEWRCEDCGQVIREDVIPKSAHSFGPWVTVREATETEEGQRLRTCSVCGATEEESIPKKEGPGTHKPDQPETPGGPGSPGDEGVSQQPGLPEVSQGAGEQQKPEAAGKPESIVRKGQTYEYRGALYRVTKKTAGKRTVEFLRPKKKNAASIKIPASIRLGGQTYQVTGIGPGALKGNKKLKTTVIGKQIKTIGARAFYGCRNLKNIRIKSKVLKKVGKNALKGISSRAKIQVPSNRLKAYRMKLKGKGQKKSVTIKK